MQCRQTVQDGWQSNCEGLPNRHNYSLKEVYSLVFNCICMKGIDHKDLIVPSFRSKVQVPQLLAMLFPFLPLLNSRIQRSCTFVTGHLTYRHKPEIVKMRERCFKCWYKYPPSKEHDKWQSSFIRHEILGLWRWPGLRCVLWCLCVVSWNPKKSLCILYFAPQMFKCLNIFPH